MTPESIEFCALGALRRDLAGCPDDCWRFFGALFREHVKIQTVRELGYDLAVSEAMLTTRFRRAGLPTPKEYLVHAIAVRVIGRLDDITRTVEQVANELGASSPQSLARSILSYVGDTPSTLRVSETGESMLDLFRERLVLPYVGILRDFRPLACRLPRSYRQTMMTRRELGAPRRLVWRRCPSRGACACTGLCLRDGRVDRAPRATGAR